MSAFLVTFSRGGSITAGDTPAATVTVVPSPFGFDSFIKYFLGKQERRKSATGLAFKAHGFLVSKFLIHHIKHQTSNILSHSLWHHFL